jgi:hypothetical protein
VRARDTRILTAKRMRSASRPNVQVGETIEQDGNNKYEVVQVESEQG